MEIAYYISQKNTLSKLYVHYGCGQCSPKEWQNYDTSPTLKIQQTPIIGWLLRKQLGQSFEPHVKYGDITIGFKDIAPNTVDGVYCSHVLEHLSLEDFRLAIKNTYAMLKPGGIFRLIMPDLKVLVDDYLADKAAGNPEASIRFVNRTILGRDVRPKNWLKQARYAFGYLHHLWLWDNESTMHELKKVGFSKLRICEFNDSSDPMFKLVENKQRFELCVRIEAIK